MRFAIFPLRLCKVLRLPWKIDARSYDVPHLSRKVISANLKIWCSKMQPLSGNQRPDLLTSLMNMSFALRLPGEMHLWRSSSNVPRLPAFLEMLQNPHVFAHFCQGAQSLAPATRKHIWTSKSAPYPSVFCTFDLEMRFAPQRRALFRYLNFQKWSENGVLCTFWLRNVLRATTACTFSTSQLPKVLRAPSVLCILTCKSASRHNGVQFFISHLASWLRTRRLASLLFDPPEPQNATNHWKNTVFRDFPTFSRICIFFLLTLLSSNLSLLSASSLLCFSSVHIVGSLTSKLPSTNISKYAEMCCPLCESYYTDTYKNVALLTFAPLRSKFVKIYEEKSKIKFRRVWLLVHTPDRPSQHTWPHPR